MIVIKTLFRCILAFIISIFFIFSFFLASMFATGSIDSNLLNSNLSENIEFVFAILIVIVPIILVLTTLITEIRIYLTKINKKIENEEIKKYGLNEEKTYEEATSYFKDFIKYLYYDDDSGMKRLLSNKGYELYMENFDLYKNKKLSEKYQILNFNLTNIIDKKGIINLEFEANVLHGINYFKNFKLNNRKMICYKIIYSYQPIINEKNCKNCGSVLKNSYKCPSCGTLLKYKEHKFKIEQIDILKEIDRWC